MALLLYLSLGWLNAAAMGGCHATFSARDLPLSGARYRGMEATLARQVGEGDAVARRDLAWLRLVHGGRSVALSPPEAASSAVDPRDLRAALHRALVLQFGGDRCEAGAVWMSLLETCRDNPRAGCKSLRGAALTHLSKLGEACAPFQPEPLERLLEGPLEPWQREQVLIMLTRIAGKAGRPAELDRYSGLRGCPAAWWVVAPSHGVTGAERKPAPGAGLGRSVSTHRCGLELFTDDARGGRFRLTADAWGKGEDHATMIITSGSPWSLHLDGHAVHHHRPQRSGLLQRVQLRVGWPAGRHRLSLVVRTEGERAQIQVSFLTEQGRPVTFSAPRGAAPGGGEALGFLPLSCAEKPDRLLGAGWPVWMLPVAHYLAAVQAHRCRDLERAFSELAAARRLAPRFAPPHLLYLEALSSDPVYPGELRRQQAEELLARLLQGDPALGEAAIQRAELAQGGQRVRRTLALLQEGARRWPGDVRWHRGLQQYYRKRSYGAEEEAALLKVLELQPAHCEALEDLGVLRQSQKDHAGARALGRRAAACDATVETILRQHLEGGRVEEALAEVQRLAALQAGDLQLQRRRVKILNRLGRKREAGESLGRLVRRTAGATNDVVGLADLLAAEGKRTEAIRILREAHRRSPWQESLTQALLRLEGRPLMQEFRLGGARVIREFQAAARIYRSPAVMVQDRVVSRIHPNGSSTSLTHNIVQVLSKEGIDRWGEVQVPRGAEVLTLRTVKRDGRIMQPEEIIGKDSISLPDLAIGDFVEVEYLEAHRPSKASRGSAVQRFFFRSVDLPLWISEFLLMAPAATPLQVESWGGAPPVRRSRRGQEIMMRWVAREQSRLLLEPRSVHLEELLPAVAVAAGGSWQLWRSHFRERLEGAARPTWHLSHLARELSRGHQERTARAREIYREVLVRVEPEGGIFEDATRSVLGGRGSRAAALVGLFRSAGIPAELWLVRPRTASWRERRVPDVQGFSAPLIRCQLPGGPVFLDPRNQAVPFGYVRPALRGAVGLRVSAGGALFSKVPTRSPLSRDRQQLKIRVELSRGGEGRVEVVEKHLGLDAQRWRLALRKMDHDAVQRTFEQGTLGYYFPGARLERVAILHQERVDRPLIVKYAFTAPNLARPGRGGLLVKSGLFPPNLGRRYLQLHQRRSPLAVDFHAPLFMEVQIIPPPGMAPAAPADDVALRTPFGALSRVAHLREGRQLVHRWELKLVNRRVSPARYPAFRRFVRAVDAHYRQEVLFTDRPAAPGQRRGR